MQKDIHPYFTPSTLFFQCRKYFHFGVHLPIAQRKSKFVLIKKYFVIVKDVAIMIK